MASSEEDFDAVAEGTGIEVVKIPPSSPELNPIGERFLGSVRGEGLDPVVILSERQLHRVLREYLETDYNSARPHQGLFQRIPARAAFRSVSEVGRNVVGLPILGGLHHDDQWAA
jgi:transposase InsO family protein